jgi:hypothetical protein
MADICSCMPLNAEVSRASESAMEASVGGWDGGVVGRRAPVVAVSGCEAPVAADTLVDGASGAEASPVVAMESDTTLLRRWALLRRL